MRSFGLGITITMGGAVLLAPGVSRGAAPATDYVVGYIHTLTVYDDSSGGVDGDGEIFVVISTSDGSNNKVVRFPQHDWEVTHVSDQVLTRYGDPFGRTKRKLNLRDTNRPWGMPFFSARVDELPETLGLTMSVLESDDPGDIGLTMADLAVPVGEAAATLAGAPPGVVTGPIEAAVGALKDFWEMDTLMVHANVFRRADLLERVRQYNATADKINVAGDATNVDGEVTVGYVFRKVRVPCGARVRVTMGDVRHYRNDDGDWDSWDDSAGEIRIHWDIWNGLWDGLTRHGDSGSFFNGHLGEGSWWRLSGASNRKLYEGELGPFLAVDFGAWDEDTGDDDLLGNIFGLWLADDLIDGLNREPNRKVTYAVERGEDGQVKTLKFTLELLSGGIDFKSPVSFSDGVSGVLLNEEFEACRTIRNSCDQTVDINLVFSVDGSKKAERAVQLRANRNTTFCFPYTFTNASDNRKTHKVNITVDGALGWPDTSIYVGPGPM